MSEMARWNSSCKECSQRNLRKRTRQFDVRKKLITSQLFQLELRSIVRSEIERNRELDVNNIRGSNGKNSAPNRSYPVGTSHDEVGESVLSHVDVTPDLNGRLEKSFDRELSADSGLSLEMDASVTNAADEFCYKPSTLATTDPRAYIHQTYLLMVKLREERLRKQKEDDEYLKIKLSHIDIINEQRRRERDEMYGHPVDNVNNQSNWFKKIFRIASNVVSNVVDLIL